MGTFRQGCIDGFPIVVNNVSVYGRIDNHMSDAMILFIDDEEHIRIADRQTLELVGFAVQTFERAEKALTVLSAQGADVVVCDTRLPGISGLDVTRMRADGTQNCR